MSIWQFTTSSGSPKYTVVNKSLHLEIENAILTTCGGLNWRDALDIRKCSTTVYGSVSPMAGLALISSNDWNSNCLKGRSVHKAVYKNIRMKSLLTNLRSLSYEIKTSNLSHRVRRVTE